MSELTVLDYQTHSALTLSPNHTGIFVRDRHMLPLRVTEITRAILDFPVFISRLQTGGDYALSALTGLEPGQNLYWDGNSWQSGFQPVAMQTYPFFLVRGKTENSEPLLGFDENSPAINSNDGDSIFTSKGKPNLAISQIRAKLMEDARGTVHTFDFFKMLDGLGLIRAVDLSVRYGNDRINKIRGLHMINEDRFHALDRDDFNALRQKGFLGSIYGLLFSVGQLNMLIRRYNERDGQSNPIKNINLEVSKDLGQI